MWKKRCPECNCLFYETYKTGNLQYGCPLCLKLYPDPFDSTISDESDSYVDLFIYFDDKEKDDFEFLTLPEEDEDSHSQRSLFNIKYL